MEDFDDYKFIRRIGKGAEGSVWLVSHPYFEDNLVLKKIWIGSRSEKSLGEARILKKLKHKHVIKYYASFYDSPNEHLFIITDFCSGGNLDDRIRQTRDEGNRFSEGQVMEWFGQILLAMNYIHENRILHRDLKTANIFLTGSNIIKVGDFGIAAQLENSCDMRRTCVGSPYYMSPEVCQDIPYNSKSDIWAMGCVLYEMCALSQAFSGSNLLFLVTKICSCKYEPLPDGFSPELHDLIQALLQSNPEQRPSASMLIQDLSLESLIESSRPTTRVGKRKSTGRGERDDFMDVNADNSDEMKRQRVKRGARSSGAKTHSAKNRARRPQDRPHSEDLFKRSIADDNSNLEDGQVEIVNYEGMTTATSSTTPLADLLNTPNASLTSTVTDSLASHSDDAMTTRTSTSERILSSSLNTSHYRTFNSEPPPPPSQLRQQQQQQPSSFASCPLPSSPGVLDLFPSQPQSQPLGQPPQLQMMHSMSTSFPQQLQSFDPIRFHQSMSMATLSRPPPNTPMHSLSRPKRSNSSRQRASSFDTSPQQSQSTSSQITSQSPSSSPIVEPTREITTRSKSYIRKTSSTSLDPGTLPPIEKNVAKSLDSSSTRGELRSHGGKGRGRGQGRGQGRGSQDRTRWSRRSISSVSPLHGEDGFAGGRKNKSSSSIPSQDREAEAFSPQLQHEDKSFGLESVPSPLAKSREELCLLKEEESSFDNSLEQQVSSKKAKSKKKKRTGLFPKALLHPNQPSRPGTVSSSLSSSSSSSRPQTRRSLAQKQTQPSTKSPLKNAPSTTASSSLSPTKAKKKKTSRSRKKAQPGSKPSVRKYNGRKIVALKRSGAPTPDAASVEYKLMEDAKNNTEDDVLGDVTNEDNDVFIQPMMMKVARRKNESSDDDGKDNDSDNDNDNDNGSDSDEDNDDVDDVGNEFIRNNADDDGVDGDWDKTFDAIPAMSKKEKAQEKKETMKAILETKPTSPPQFKSMGISRARRMTKKSETGNNADLNLDMRIKNLERMEREGEGREREADGDNFYVASMNVAQLKSPRPKSLMGSFSSTLTSIFGKILEKPKEMKKSHPEKKAEEAVYVDDFEDDEEEEEGEEGTEVALDDSIENRHRHERPRFHHTHRSLSNSHMFSSLDYDGLDHRDSSVASDESISSDMGEEDEVHHVRRKLSVDEDENDVDEDEDEDGGAGKVSISQKGLIDEDEDEDEDDDVKPLGDLSNTTFSNMNLAADANEDASSSEDDSDSDEYDLVEALAQARIAIESRADNYDEEDIVDEKIIAPWKNILIKECLDTLGEKNYEFFFEHLSNCKDSFPELFVPSEADTDNSKGFSILSDMARVILVTKDVEEITKKDVQREAAVLNIKDLIAFDAVFASPLAMSTR
eukprot:m.74011 g.74011  ORF g.74011 m.74011 type:complete len:1372 (-) comp8436_c0_seq1:783-4898(-)